MVLSVFSNLSDETKWLDIKELSELTWKQCQQVQQLKKKLKDNFNNLQPIDQQEIRSLQPKIALFNTKVQSYEPSLCRIIWEIITLSFTFLKVRGIRKSLASLAKKAKTVADKVTSTPPTSPKASDPAKDLKTSKSLAHPKLQERIKRKKAIVDRAIQILNTDTAYASTTDKTIQATKTFFIKRQQELSQSKDICIGGSFYHCTSQEGSYNPDHTKGLLGILASSTLLCGTTNVYGMGVYASTVPEETSYGKYFFAIDETIDETAGHDHIADIQLIKKSAYENRFWATFRGLIKLRSDVVLLGVPDDEFSHLTSEYQKVHKMYRVTNGYIEILPRSVFTLVGKLKDQAENELGLVHLPEKSLWSLKTPSGHIPDRFKKAAAQIKTATFIPSATTINKA